MSNGVCSGLLRYEHATASVRFEASIAADTIPPFNYATISSVHPVHVISCASFLLHIRSCATKAVARTVKRGRDIGISMLSRVAYSMS